MRDTKLRLEPLDFSTPNDALRIALLQRVVPLLMYFQRKPVIAQ